MKLEPVTKLDKKKKQRQKILTMTSCRKFVVPLSFFGFLTNLEQSGGRIPDRESAKFMFSLTVIFCLKKTEKHRSHTIALSKSTFLDKKR